MWLLKFHFAFSLLCLLTFTGFKVVGKEIMKQNGWLNDDDNKKKSIFVYWIFFVPILNVLILIVEFLMLGMKKEDFDKKCEEIKNKKTNN